MNTPRNYYDYFSEQLMGRSKRELVEYFNQAVGLRAFGISRQGYLCALRNQIEKSGMDFSEVGDAYAWSFACKVDLVNNKMIKRKPAVVAEGE